jgi:hypothetical protein
MTTDITELEAREADTPSATTIANLVRRLGDREVPASGTWTVVPTSHVALARGRGDHPVPVRIVDGAFEIDERPERSTIHLALGGPHPMTFLGRATRVAANHGMSEWSIAGTLTRDRRAEPMAFTVTYHGVFRSSGRAWAWFSGSGAVETPTKRRWWRRSHNVERTLVVLDLLLDSPASPASRSTLSRAA